MFASISSYSLAQGAPDDDAPLFTAAAALVEISELYVWGKRQSRMGAAMSASEGDVAFGEFADRPLLRPGELAEVVPGLGATQHSGTGKANQFFLRGFNLDHGTDFSVTLDGVPLNLRSHAHGQGYLDLNILTPEIVERIRYRKGPYHAETGDFSSAGAADFETFEQLPASLAQITAGADSYGRLLAAVGDAQGYAAVDVTLAQGPWERGENLRKLLLTVRRRAGDGVLTGVAYDARWNATDQVPHRAVSAGLVGRLGGLDSTAGGETRRLILSAQRRAGGSSAMAYLQRYEVNLWSNFTYFLDDPVRGDQFEQAERRWIAGGAVRNVWTRSAQWSYAGGAEARYDAIDQIGLYRTASRRRLATLREDSVDQWSAALWGEARWRRGPLRAVVGLRADAMGVRVRDRSSGAAAGAEAVLFSPKVTLAARLADQLEVYANFGRGFHSNDARGAAVRSTHGTEAVADLLVPALGREIGVRLERPGLAATLALWALELDSELVYVGDAGDTERAPSSRRVGVEALLNWSPVRRLNLDISGALTRSRYRSLGAGQDRIPNALEYVITGGATYRFSDTLTAGLTLRTLGPAALSEDNSVRSSPSSVANLLVRQQVGRAEISAEVLNILDSQDDDIRYYYTSRLPGEPEDGVEDAHFHPVPPRTVRLTLRLKL